MGPRQKGMPGSTEEFHGSVPVEDGSFLCDLLAALGASGDCNAVTSQQEAQRVKCLQPLSPEGGELRRLTGVNG